MLRRLAPALLLALAACSNNDGTSVSSSTSHQPASPGAPATAAAPSDSAERVIAEADIVQLSNGRLYAIAKSGTLSIIDVSVPGTLSILGEAFVGGAPFEMYLNGDRVVLLMDDATGTSASVFVLAVHDPALIDRVGSWTVSGAISDSRMVGDILYLVTSGADTYVTSINLLGQPGSEVDHLTLPSSSGARSREKKSVLFGNGRMYVGGQDGIHLVDVSDASGKLSQGAHIDSGPITERWQMSEKDDVLRVIVQNGALSAQTYQIWNPRSVQQIRSVSLPIPGNQRLKAVRFDGDRAYAITFQQIDPLFIVDFSQEPRLRGQLHMPGYIVDLEPRGNRLLGFGVDESDPNGTLNVSLLDVSDLDEPKQIQRVSFGHTTATPEDQDRLQKAYRVGADGMITLPFPGPVGSSCQTGGGIQLVKMDNDTIYASALVKMQGNPRRALVNQDELIGVSDSNVTAFQISTRQQTADLVIGTCSEIATYNGGTVTFGNDAVASDRMYECTTSRVGGHGGSAAGLIGLGIAFGAVARRRRS